MRKRANRFANFAPCCLSRISLMKRNKPTTKKRLKSAKEKGAVANDSLPRSIAKNDRAKRSGHGPERFCSRTVCARVPLFGFHFDRVGHQFGLNGNDSQCRLSLSERGALRPKIAGTAG